MIPFLGQIMERKMNLSEAGIIVNDFWLKIPSHFKNVSLDEFIIMPDHMHGIIIKNLKPESKSKYVDVETPNLGVSTMKSRNLYWKSNSLGSIINQFKRICTIKTKSNSLDLVWQPRFYDHIIGSKKELDHIRTYIKNNPDNWLNDENGIK
jgi:REP element-mobilizing transposase RayT